MLKKASQKYEKYQIICFELTHFPAVNLKLFWEDDTIVMGQSFFLIQPRSQDVFPFLNIKKGKSPGDEVVLNFYINKFLYTNIYFSTQIIMDIDSEQTITGNKQ